MTIRSFLRNIPLIPLVEQLRFYQAGEHNHGTVVLTNCGLDLGWKNGNTVVDTIMKSQVMTFEFELPINGVEIVFFVGESDAETIGKNGSHLVEPLQSAVIRNYGFCASECGS